MIEIIYTLICIMSLVLPLNPACKPTCNLYHGDLNCDGVVGEADYKMLDNYLHHGVGFYYPKMQKERANVYGDMFIDEKDLQEMRDYLDGKTDKFNICKRTLVSFIGVDS
jgi:hypothetical protein